MKLEFALKNRRKTSEKSAILWATKTVTNKVGPGTISFGRPTTEAQTNRLSHGNQIRTNVRKSIEMLQMVRLMIVIVKVKLQINARNVVQSLMMMMMMMTTVVDMINVIMVKHR